MRSSDLWDGRTDRDFPLAGGKQGYGAQIGEHMKMAEAGDPLNSAEIEVIAVDHPIEVAGFVGAAAVAIPAGQGMKLPAGAPPEPEPTIWQPPPLGNPVHALFGVESAVDPPTDAEISTLPPEAPVVYSVTGTKRVDLRHFRDAAAQAAKFERRLVIVTRGG